MKYRITGADRGTGEDKTITVDAEDERAATLTAKARNMLVSEIAPAPLDINYQSHPLVPHTHVIRHSDYNSIERAATSLDWLRQFFGGLGVVCIFGALICIVAFFATIADPPTIEGKARATYLLAGAISCFCWMIILFSVSAIMRMLAAMGMALKDMAVNSYRP